MHEMWRDQLPFYVAGMLSANQRESLEQHLAGCDECRAVVRMWQTVAHAVREDVSTRVAVALPPPLILPPLPVKYPGLSHNGRKNRLCSHKPDGRKDIRMSISAAPLPNRLKTATPLRPHALPRGASLLLVLVLLSGMLALMAVFASHTMSPGSGGFANQAGGLTPTLLPTATPLPPTSTPVPEPVTLNLNDIRYEAQSWNNGGPASLAMALSYYGWAGDQESAARWLRPNGEDKSVTPWQLVQYVQNETEYAALSRIGGTTTLLKQLLAAGYPIIVQTGFQPASEGWMGHYVLLVGYDETQQHFLTFDSYLGSNQNQGRPSPYDLIDEGWQQFNRVFIVIYELSRETELREVLGDYIDPEHGYTTALDVAQQDIRRDPEDKWAWFNIGSAYVALGDYEEASTTYDEALQLGLPFRMLWYQFGPYEAYYQVGRYDDVLHLAENTSGTTPYVEETSYWMGMAYMAQDRFEEAVEQFQEVLRFNPNFEPSQALIQ